jgi:para-nitrobenzyl esterase
VACLSGSPNIDGWSFIQKYPEALDAGLQSDMPTLTGFTGDDFGPPARILKTTVHSFADELSASFGQRKAEFAAIKSAFIAQCRVVTDQDAREMIKHIQQEYRMCDTFRWATRRARTAKSPVYTYLFQQPIPWPEHPQFGAFHSSDLVYWFANLEKLNRPWTADDRKISEHVSYYLVQFVKNGNPNGKMLPNWSAFDPDVPQTMALGLHLAPREIATEARLPLYRQLWK